MELVYSKLNIEHTVVKHLLRGNKEDFSLLYDKYAPALFGLIVGITGDMQLSEVVLQKSFVKIWEQKGMYDTSVAKIFTWMMRIAREEALEAMKGKANPGLNIEPGTPLLNNVAGETPLSGQMQKATLYLVFVKGRSCKEAAMELNISVEMLKMNFRSAIKQKTAVSL